MASGIFGESQATYRRLLLIVLGEAITGTFLYTVFKLMPLALQMMVALASWVILENEILTFPKNKSLASLLSAITGGAASSCFVAWRITNQEFWSRLMLVGMCLSAGLIFLDRRQEWFD